MDSANTPLSSPLGMSIHGVIFDCDGTLVDTEPLANDVFAAMLCAEGLPMTGHEAMSRFRGMKWDACFAEVEVELGRKLPPGFSTELHERTSAAYRSGLKPIPGIIELVSSLDIPICVASNGKREQVEFSLSLTGLLPHFTGRIFSSYDIGVWKPEPDLFLHAAKAMGVEPANCAVVEDSVPGIQAGISAGMKVFAFQPTVVDGRIPAGIPIIQSMSELQTLFKTRMMVKPAPAE
jgi:HAD superfamily hydrolase (TIGR01509 family)